MLRIERILDLSKEQDRQELLAAASDDAELRNLLNQNLDDYCRYFPGDDWQRIYSDGMLSIRVAEKLQLGYDIKHQLELAAAMTISTYSRIRWLQILDNNISRSAAGNRNSRGSAESTGKVSDDWLQQSWVVLLADYRMGMG